MDRTAICNAALAHIGQARISDFDAPGPTAQACRDAWDLCRQSALRSYHWNFALHRMALSASATAPQHGYSYAFSLPTDYLKAIQVNGLTAGTSWAEFSIEGGNILTNDSTVNLWYVRDVEESSRWDSAFIEFFTYRLAAAVASRITTSTSLAESLEARAMAMLDKAKEGDADESSPHVIRGVQYSGYATARRGYPLNS